MVLTEEVKAHIDRMSHVEMCREWRFAPIGSPLFQGESGEYFQKRLFDELGGFTPAISKAIGWGD